MYKPDTTNTRGLGFFQTEKNNLPTRNRFSVSPFTKPVSATPSGVPVVVPFITPLPIFANIDNSAMWAADAAKKLNAEAKAAPSGGALPAGITAVDYSAKAPKRVDWLKMSLYGVGALGILMALNFSKGR